jgi:radical SAM superfamily enzyme YgiQ (UPF0313 family)
MKIALIECCEEQDKGSIGAFYIKTAIEKHGYIVDELRHTKKGYDIELISVHHCSDFVRLANMPKRATYRLVGGHPMQNNPRPAIPYADAVFIGEGEEAIGKSIDLVSDNGIEGLKNVDGWIITENWNGEIPKTIMCTPLPNNPPYLNRPNTGSAAWYIEIARGCPFSCAYCELGNSIKYRYYQFEHIKNIIDSCDLKKTRKINFFAPDEASYPWFNELTEYVKNKGFLASFSSMRLDSVLRNKPNVKANTLIRIGLDGLTEETRFKVGKKLTNQMVIEYFKYMLDSGHVNFKIFMIFGYEWEQLSDFAEFEKLMRMVNLLPKTKNVSIRIKWTPFIPQPCTPLGITTPKYDYDMVDKINVWHALNARPRRNPGIYFENDGLMSKKSHERQVSLTKGNENIIKELGLLKHYENAE